MPEALSAKEFRDFVDLYTHNHADHTERLDKIDATLAEHTVILADHTKRLDRIEQLLWHGERLAEVERRVIKLAEIAGAADLATPFTTPIGI